MKWNLKTSIFLLIAGLLTSESALAKAKAPPDGAGPSIDLPPPSEQPLQEELPEGPPC